MLILIQKLSLIIKQGLIFLFWYVRDVFLYYWNKEYKKFAGFGLHIFVGRFGSGKTTAMVKSAYDLATRYKDMGILTNIKLMNFPEHTVITPLVHYSQIMTCPPNTLIMVDEISSIFNSRDWKKEGIPAVLLSHLLQVRKRKKMMYATAQRWKHVDKLIRDITFTVYDCKTLMGVGKRWTWVTAFDALDVENENVMNVPVPISVDAFIMTDKVRALFDTDELVEKLDKAEYVSDEEMLERIGERTEIMVTAEQPKKKFGLKRRKA